jgi:predicted molibdopterin-dependent oxidoreductase YjgC
LSVLNRSRLLCLPKQETGTSQDKLMNVTITIDGSPLECQAGLTLAAAMYLNEQRVLRVTPRDGLKRSVFCGMGVCYDCLVKVDGRANVRACQTIVAEGMKVLTQQGEPDLESLA